MRDARHKETIHTPRGFSRALVFALIGGLISISIAPAFGAEPDCPELEGDFQPGGLLWGRAAPETSLAFNGVDVPVLADGIFLLGLGRDAPETLSLEIDDELTCTIDIKRREYRISRVKGVPQRTVTPPEDQLARIRAERQRVRSAKAKRVQRQDFLEAVKSGLAWPVTGRISGVYGSQRFYNGKPGNPHYGVDVARPTGTPVLSPGPGVITLAEPDLFYSGGTVILDHGYGLSSSFLHMSRIDVRVGDEVQTGDPIGAIGATGRATGPHLDWRMSWFNQRIDPQLLVPPMP